MLTANQLQQAVVFNSKLSGKSWNLSDLPSQFSNLSPTTDAFALAVADFQSKNNLSVDGKLGVGETLPAMKAAKKREGNKGRVLGFDVSGNNGELKSLGVDKVFKTAYDAGYRFVYIKASEGETYQYGRYKECTESALAQGLIPGPYHFATPTPTAKDAQKEVSNFLKALDKVWGPGQLPAMLDFEYPSKYLQGMTAKDLISWTHDFITTFNGPIGFYTYLSYWRERLDRTKDGLLTSLPLWQAEYPNKVDWTVDEPTKIGWDDWTIWQFAGGTGRIPGLSGAYDQNVFNGTQEALKKFTRS